MSSELNPEQMEAIRSMSQEEREQNKRIYLVVNTSLPLDRTALTVFSARATWQTLKASLTAQPERFEEYDSSEQPKIALRVKSNSHIERALTEAETAGLPAAMIRTPSGKGAIVGIGPASRAELPSFVRKLQMLNNEPEAGGNSDALIGPIPLELPRLIIYVRADLDLPFGKLAAQAGHAAWGALQQAMDRCPSIITSWSAAGMPIAVEAIAHVEAMEILHGKALSNGLPSAFIVDAGWTVFGKPTPTVLGIGPVFGDETALKK